MKIRKIALAIASAAALATTGSALATTGTATAEVTAMPPALAIEEVQPYTMQLERKPGATMPTGQINLYEWDSAGLLADPAESVQPGCLKVTGDLSKPVTVGVTSFTNLTAPGGAEIGFSVANPDFEIATSTTDCASASAGTFQTVDLGGAGLSTTTGATGELYVAWRYKAPTTTLGGFMQMSQWEEGVFTGTVDVQVDYAM
jgi:hypothetical protein